MAITDDFPKILTSTWHLPDSWRRQYARTAEKALKEMKPDDLINEVKTSGLRGRGGAGFPTGMKWSFVPKESKKPKYVAINADEGEPGTFKDRELLGRDANRMVEGAILTALRDRRHDVTSTVRGEFFREHERFEYAVDQALQERLGRQGHPGTDWHCDIASPRARAPTSAAKRPRCSPRSKASKGWPSSSRPSPRCRDSSADRPPSTTSRPSQPFPWIVMNGGKAYASIGTEKSTGTRLYGASGRVNKPGVYELPMGYNLKKFVHEVAGGVPGGKSVKCVIPGGSSTPIVTEAEVPESRPRPRVARRRDSSPRNRRGDRARRDRLPRPDALGLPELLRARELRPMLALP